MNIYSIIKWHNSQIHASTYSMCTIIVYEAKIYRRTRLTLGNELWVTNQLFKSIIQFLSNIERPTWKISSSTLPSHRHLIKKGPCQHYVNWIFELNINCGGVWTDVSGNFFRNVWNCTWFFQLVRIFQMCREYVCKTIDGQRIYRYHVCNPRLNKPCSCRMPIR